MLVIYKHTSLGKILCSCQHFVFVLYLWQGNIYNVSYIDIRSYHDDISMSYRNTNFHDIWLNYIMKALESFHLSLFLFLYDWLLKRWEITKVVSVNCNGFHLLRYTSRQMHVNKIISEPAIRIIKCNVNIAVCWKTTSMVISCMCFWAVVCQYSRCYQACAILDPFQHVLIQITNYQICNILIDLYIFKAVISDYSCFCVDIIINKHLNKYN